MCEGEVGEEAVPRTEIGADDDIDTGDYIVS
jgi:hypothetical protein